MDEPDMSQYTRPAGFNGKSLQDIREMIKRAYDGSFEDEQYLAVSAPAIPTELIGEALPMFCKYLDITPAQLNIAPCSIYSPAVTMQYGFAIMALNGLGYINRPPNVGVLSCVEKSWPNIREWVKFYYEDKLSGGPVWITPPKDKRIKCMAEAQALTVLTGVLAFGSVTTISSGSVEKLAKDQGETFRILARVWLRAIPHEHVELDVKRRLSEIVKSALSDFLRASSKAWSLDKARDIIFSEAKKKSRVVVNTALAYIKEAPSFNDVGMVLPSVNITYLLLCGDNKLDESTVFEKSFLEAGISQIITRIFVHFSTAPNDTYRYAEGILNNCLLTMVAVLESPCGFAQTPSMLKLGLLDGIANYMLNFYKTDRSTVDPLAVALRSIVGNLLPNYLIHYAVLGSAIQATKDIIRSKNLKVFEKSIIALEWFNFYNILLERAAIKALYDINLKNRDHLVCHNCGASEQKFQTCSGCKTAIYCSRDCQKAAWKDKSHKLECETLKKFTGDKYFNLHSNLFLPNVVSFDLKRFAPGIEALISKKSDLRAAGSDIGYAINYVEGEICIPTLQIFPFRASSISNNPLLAFVDDSDPTNDNAVKIDNAFKRLDKNQRIVHVTFYRGGMYKESALYLHDVLKEGVKPGDPPGMTNPRRRNAMDDIRNDVAWTWDNVDTIMFKALQADENAPKKNTKTAKETVFDRIVKFAKEVEETSEPDDNHGLHASPASILQSSTRNNSFLNLRILSPK